MAGVDSERDMDRIVWEASNAWMELAEKLMRHEVSHYEAFLTGFMAGRYGEKDKVYIVSDET